MLIDLDPLQMFDLDVLLESHIETLAVLIDQKKQKGENIDELQSCLQRHWALKLMLRKPLDF